jgi:hypothetical protein
MNWVPYTETLQNHKLTEFFTFTDFCEEMNKMASLKETAKAYVPPQTKNIADLDIVQTTLDLKTKVVNEGTPEEFSYDYIVVDEIEYRVPKSVIKQLKAQLEANPSLEAFQVTYEGEGLNREYTVIPRM